jgi:hypothetical protein
MGGRQRESGYFGEDRNVLGVEPGYSLRQLSHYSRQKSD